MAPRVVSKGSGPVRDLIVTYLDGSQAAVQLDPMAVVLSDNGPAFSEFYGNVPGKRGIATYPELLQTFADVAEGATLGRVILVGFSEGCQAIRTHAMDGYFADGAVCADGTHLGIPAEGDKRAAWQALVDRAASGGAPFAASHSHIVTEPSYMSTRAVLSLLTGHEMPSSDAIEDLGTYRDGNLTVRSWGGTTAPAHVNQATNVLPLLLADVLATAVPGGGSSYSAGGRIVFKLVAMAVGTVAGVVGAKWLMDLLELPVPESRRTTALRILVQLTRVDFSQVNTQVRWERVLLAWVNSGENLPRMLW